MQLTLDRMKSKYMTQIDNDDQEIFRDNLKILNNQIKQIENLVNEFSDFARMPKPIFKDNNLVSILTDNIKLLSEIDGSIKIKLKKNPEKIILNCDKEQLSRVFFNLIKKFNREYSTKNRKKP